MLSLSLALSPFSLSHYSNFSLVRALSFLSHYPSLSLALSLFLSLSLTHTHTRSLARSISLSVSYTHTLSLSLCPSRSIRLDRLFHRRPSTPPAHQPSPTWRQPRGKWMVSLVSSHTNATSKRLHLWEIDFRFALNSTPGW
jgi:hypothetical protein